MNIETLHRSPGASIELIGMLPTELDDDLLGLLDVDEWGKLGATFRDS